MQSLKFTKPFFGTFLETEAKGKKDSIGLSNRIQTGQLSITHPSLIHQLSKSIGKMTMTWQMIENIENKYQWYIDVPKIGQP